MNDEMTSKIEEAFSTSCLLPSDWIGFEAGAKWMAEYLKNQNVCTHCGYTRNTSVKCRCEEQE